MRQRYSKRSLATETAARLYMKPERKSQLRNAGFGFQVVSFDTPPPGSSNAHNPIEVGCGYQRWTWRTVLLPINSSEGFLSQSRTGKTME